MKQNLLHTTLFGVFGSVVFALSAQASPQEDPYQNTLLGDVYGVRSALADKGVDVTVEYKADFWSVASGGLKTGTNYLDNLDIKFAIDGEKAFGIQGNKAFISFLNNNGGKPNLSRVGSVQAIDNIEAATGTFKLYEAWVDQSFFDNHLSVLFGLHDLNTEFNMLDMTANFIKPVLQVNQSFAQTGENAPSIFPNTSLAFRVKVAPTEDTYLSLAAFDGIPGNPNHPNGTHIDFNKQDGALLIAEAGYTPKSEGEEVSLNKYAIGVWGYTHKMDDLVALDDDGSPLQRRMHGYYALAAHQLYHQPNSDRTIGGFIRAGVADGNTEQTAWDYETGLVAHGWVPTRADSEIGATFTQNHNSGAYMEANPDSNENEYGVELYYRDQIISGVALQPDFQYVINPGTDPTLENAVIVGLRADILL